MIHNQYHIKTMEQLVKQWCNTHKSITDYSIPNIPVLIKESHLIEWELREEDKSDFENWLPIYTNCTGVNYTTYYYNLNKQSLDHGKILGMWAHCFSGDIDILIVAQSVEEFTTNPKYRSLIGRSNDYSNGLKVSFMTDYEL